MLDQILKKLGVSDSDTKEYQEGKKTADDFIGFLNENYISKKLPVNDPAYKELRSSVTGEITRPIYSEMGKKLGISKDKMEGKRWEEVLDIGIEGYKTKIKELEEANKKGDSEKSEKVGKELSDLRAKYESKEQELLDSNKEKEDIKKAAKDEINNFKIGTYLEKIKSKLPFKDGMTELEKEGFEAAISKNFKFAIADNDEFQILNDKGERIYNEAKSSYLTPDDAIRGFAISKNVLKQNNSQGGQPVIRKITQPDLPDGGMPKRASVHPNAMSR